MTKNNTVNDPGVPHLSLSGGTMTGNLFLNADPTSATQAATKSYVDARVGLPIGSMQYFANTGGDSTLTSLGWKKCDGSILSQASYPALYAQVGLINAPGATWTVQSVNQLNNAAYTSVYGGGNYVVTGTASTLITSTDAKNWTQVPIPLINACTWGAYGNSMFYLQNGNGIMTSTDAVTWKTKLPELQAFQTYNTNLFLYRSSTYVVVGSNGGTNAYTGMGAVSTDGVSFRNLKTLLPTPCCSLAFGNSLYVVGSTGGRVYTSTDALTWSIQSTNASNTTQALVYGSQFVGAGDTGYLATSTNGANGSWTNQTSGTTSSIYTLCNNGSSLYVYGGAGGVLATSTNAVTWTARTSGTTSSIVTSTFGTVYVYGANGGVIASSTDAITWTARTSGTSSTISGLTYANSLYVYCTIGGGLATSTDATTWTVRTSGTTSNLYGVQWDGTNWHAMGPKVHLTSTNAVTWSVTAQYPSGFGVPTAAIYGTSSFVVGDNAGNVATTTDALTWNTPQATGTGLIIMALYQGAGGLYVVGTSGTTGGIATSTNATTWTVRTNPFTGVNFADGVYGNSLYVLVGSSGTILTSTDAITWTRKPNTFPQTQSAFTAINYSQGLYVLASQTNINVYTSTDVNTWVNVTLPSSASGGVEDVNICNGLFLLPALGTYIFSASATYPYATNTQFQLPLDAGGLITTQGGTDFQRSLYIKAT